MGYSVLKHVLVRSYHLPADTDNWNIEVTLSFRKADQRLWNSKVLCVQRDGQPARAT